MNTFRQIINLSQNAKYTGILPFNSVKLYFDRKIAHMLMTQLYKLQTNPNFSYEYKFNNDKLILEIKNKIKKEPPTTSQTYKSYVIEK